MYFFLKVLQNWFYSQEQKMGLNKRHCERVYTLCILKFIELHNEAKDLRDRYMPLTAWNFDDNDGNDETKWQKTYRMISYC